MTDKNESAVIGDIFKLLSHLIERIFEELRLSREEQRLTHQVLTQVMENRKTGKTDQLNRATGDIYNLWQAIHNMEKDMVQIVVAQGTLDRKINEIRDWLMPRRVRFKKWWDFWKDRLV